VSDITGDTTVTLEPPEYPDRQDIDERRRAYVLDCMTQCGDAPSIDGKVFVGNLDLVCKWLEKGAVPAARLKPVA